MSVPQAPRCSLSEQIAAILPLADCLYDSTVREPTLINQARNELDLLRSVIDLTRTSLVLLCVDYPVVALEEALGGCRLALLELEELHQQAGEVGPENPLSDIRERFSSLIFELSVMNADMMMCVDSGPVSEVRTQVLTYSLDHRRPMSTACCEVILKMFERGSESLHLSHMPLMMLPQKQRRMKHGNSCKMNCMTLALYPSGRIKTTAISFQPYGML